MSLQYIYTSNLKLVFCVEPLCQYTHTHHHPNLRSSLRRLAQVPPHRRRNSTVILQPRPATADILQAHLLHQVCMPPGCATLGVVRLRIVRHQKQFSLGGAAAAAPGPCFRNSPSKQRETHTPHGDTALKD